jgi:LysM repeat protein
VSPVPRHRRRRKIRRTGQHTAPSQVEKVAQTAGKAAPAVVVAGALATAAPQASGSAAAAAVTAAPAAGPAGARHVTRAHLDVAVHAAHAGGRRYTVQAGDTLSGIAQRFYGQAADWRGLYAANQPEISNPGLIYVGQELRVPRHLPAAAASPAGTQTTGYTPRHASSEAGSTSQVTTTSLSGTLSCSGLEALWREAGGSPAAEVTAASIAMAESGGNEFATGTVGERGYWQINPVNGDLSTYDPYGNARAAVILSADGTNWSPWTTFTSGAYAGRC